MQYSECSCEQSESSLLQSNLFFLLNLFNVFVCVNVRKSPFTNKIFETDPSLSELHRDVKQISKVQANSQTNDSSLNIIGHVSIYYQLNTNVINVNVRQTLKAAVCGRQFLHTAQQGIICIMFWHKNTDLTGGCSRQTKNISPSFT